MEKNRDRAEWHPRTPEGPGHEGPVHAAGLVPMVGSDSNYGYDIQAEERAIHSKAVFGRSVDNR